jgi:hypothetical protein
MVLGAWVHGTRDAECELLIAAGKALVSWAQATTDNGKATRLRAQAAMELERAQQAPGTTADLNPLLSERNDQQMYKAGGKREPE